MAHHLIYLPIDAYLRAQDIQRRRLEYEIDADQAGYEMAELLAPHCSRLPGPDDTTDILLQRPQRIFLTRPSPRHYPLPARRRKPPAH